MGTKNVNKIFKASLENEKEILEFLKNNPSGGLIQLRLDREPSFYESMEVEGESNDVIIGKNFQNNEIIGIGSRSEKRCYINGKEGWIGYLGGLRISPRYRSSLFLWRGYSYLNKLHRKRNTKLYLTTIMSDNLVAKKILTSNRTSLPVYHDIGEYYTYLVNPRSFSKLSKVYNPNIFIKKAEKEDIPYILEFYQQNSNSRQFFPLYTQKDILSEKGILKDLRISDMLLAFENNILIGTVAIWNQNKFRRWLIDKYHPFVKIYRPLYNSYAFLRNMPTLPQEKRVLNYKILSLIKVKNDREDVWKSLLYTIWQESKNTSEQNLIMAGFHEKDPLISIFQKIPNWRFSSTLYCVYWRDDKVFFDSLTPQIPYIELGSL